MTVWRTFYQHLMTDVDRPPIRVEHTVPPVDAVDQAARLATIDLHIAELAAVPPEVRTPEQQAEMDRLLDLRLSLQSTLPPLGIRTATPGGAS